jgi:Domain of unknown function (DUF5667)
MERLEQLAERLRSVDPVAPSPAAKIRGWNLVLAAVDRAPKAESRAGSITRLMLAAAAAGVLLVAGAVAASADSLPDSALYPIKTAVEQARGILAFSSSDRLALDLELSRTRLAEAEAMVARHRLDLADRALSALDDELTNAAELVQAEKAGDPALASDMENQLRQAVATHDQQLAGLQGQVTNPVAIESITRARDRAAQALELAAKPAPSNGNGGSPSSSPNGGKGNGNGNGPSPSPHPTPRH